jgi:hypothetical protein
LFNLALVIVSVNHQWLSRGVWQYALFRLNNHGRMPYAPTNAMAETVIKADSYVYSFAVTADDQNQIEKCLVEEGRFSCTEEIKSVWYA